MSKRGNQDVKQVAVNILSNRHDRSNMPRRKTPGVLQAFDESPTLQSVVSKIADDVSANPYKLIEYRGTSSRELDVHPLLDVLQTSTAGLPVGGQIFLISAWLKLVGEGGLLKVRDDRGKVIALWPLPPTWVTFRPFDNISPYSVQAPNSSERPIPQSEIIWFMKPRPFDPYTRGSGLGAGLSDEIEISELTSKTIKQWFFNDAKPDLIVAFEELTEGQANEFKQKWEENHQGFRKKYKPDFVAGTKLQIHEINTSFKDMELSQLRKDQREIVAQTFGVPPEILGNVTNSNRATITGAKQIYAENVLIPDLRLIFNQLNSQLVWPDFGENLSLEYISPVDSDRDFQLSVMQAASWAFSVDEFRALADHPALENNKGQVFMIPPTVFPVSNPADEPDFGMSNPDSQKMITVSKADSIGKLWPKIEEAIKGKPLSPVMMPVIAETVKYFGEKAGDQFKTKTFDFNLVDPKVVEFLRNTSGERLEGKIQETTLRELRNIFARAETEALPIEQVAAEVESTMEQASTLRAFTIARTETVRAANFGNFEAGNQYGIEQKEWLATMDGRERDEHAYLDGQEPIPYKEAFTGPNGEKGMYPGDFQEAYMSINCRCTVLPVIGEKSAYNTVEKRTKRWSAHERQRLKFELSLRRVTRARIKEQTAAVMAVLKEAN